MSSDPRQLLANLVHELRQPLGTIETSAYYLDVLLRHPDGQVKEQLRLIERQVARAANLLADAAARAHGFQTAGCEEDTEGSLVLTNAATAVVT
jgi:signal transduction histidine kinase